MFIKPITPGNSQISSCHVSSPHPRPFSPLSLSLPICHFHSRPLQSPRLSLLRSSNTTNAILGRCLIPKRSILSDTEALKAMAISLVLPDIAFVAPNPSRGHRFAVSGKMGRVYRASVGSSRGKVRIRALYEEDLLSGGVNGYGLNGGSNGVATPSRITNGSVGNVGGNGYYVEEAVILEERDRGNGNLGKYVNGNGVAKAEKPPTAMGVVEGMTEMEVLEEKEEGRKRRIEEVGKEEAWFKQSARDQLEVKSNDDCVL